MLGAGVLLEVRVVVDGPNDPQAFLVAGVGVSIQRVVQPIFFELVYVGGAGETSRSRCYSVIARISEPIIAGIYLLENGKIIEFIAAYRPI